MKTINVSRLWEGIPAYYVLSVLGAHINLPSDRRLWEIQKIEIDREARFHLVHLGTEDTGLIILPLSHFIENMEEYLSNPKNLLIFTHRLLDRVMQYEKVMGDIQSQYFERGRKHKFLNKYIVSHPFNIHIKPIIERIIGELDAQPPLIMWILECLRENFPLKEKEIEFRTSDGECRVLLEDPQISDFPSVFAHKVASPYSPVSFPPVPFYFDKRGKYFINDTDLRTRIYRKKPIHSMFLQNASWLDIFCNIAGRILRFINEYILIEPENLFFMTLEEVYYSSWNEEKSLRPVLSYVNLAEDIIVRHLKAEKENLISHGVEGSTYLKETTVRKYLEEFYHILKS